MTTKPRTFDDLAQELIIRCKLSMTYEESDPEYRERVVAHLRTLEELAATPELNMATASGRALSMIANDMYAMRRRWYEHAPWLGDRWLRRRMRDAWKPAKRVPFTAIMRPWRAAPLADAIERGDFIGFGNQEGTGGNDGR